MLANGFIQNWSYGAEERGKFLSELKLVSEPQASVIDVCFNIAQNALYWCEEKGEGENSSCDILKRQVVEGMKAVFLLACLFFGKKVALLIFCGV